MELKNVICETPEQFHAECEKWAGKGVVRGRKLIAYGETVAELVTSQRGGFREGAGRKRIDAGIRHTWTIPADIDELASERGTAWLWEAVRFKVAFDKMKQQ